MESAWARKHCGLANTVGSQALQEGGAGGPQYNGQSSTDTTDLPPPRGHAHWHPPPENLLQNRDAARVGPTLLRGNPVLNGLGHREHKGDQKARGYALTRYDAVDILQVDPLFRLPDTLPVLREKLLIASISPRRSPLEAERGRKGARCSEQGCLGYAL